MPKNAVQRLQKLHYELKNVISIYDVANEKSHEALEKKNRKVLPSRYLFHQSAQFSEHSGYQPGSRIPYRKSVSFIPRPIGDIQSSHTTKRKCLPPKPDSAPSFSSGLKPISESDYHFKKSPEQKKHSEHQKENFFPINGSTKDDYGDDSDWSNINSSVMCEIILSPSKTLETANEILKRNNYGNSAGEESSEEDQTTFEIADCRVVEDSSEGEGAKSETSEDHVSKNNSKVSISQIKKKEDSLKKNSASDVCLSNGDDLTLKSTVSYVNVYDSSKKSRPKVQFPKLSTSPENFKKEPQVKPSPEISQITHSPNKKTQETEKERSKSGERTISRKQVKKFDIKEKSRANSKITFIFDGNDLENIKAQEKLSNKKPSSAHEKRKSKIETVKDRRNKSEEDITLAKKIINTNKIEDGLGEVEVPGLETDECDKKYQTVNTKEDGENMEKEVKELSRILEKNNEKLEKMKVSKDLALDIAKQLKDKYNKIRNSKNELLQRLKKAEMDNERLSDKVKDEKNSKIILQKKMDEIRQDSNTLILEQNIKNKEILEENAWLKSKLKELETLYEQEKAQRQLNNSSQRDRTLENKYNLKLQENVSEENIQRLIKEKSEMVFKTETLRRLLRERELQVKSLEAIISEYEEELRQNQQLLQEKTERLDDTNKELESIRQNSKDLEEQVKMLRISIESFDQIHQNLIKQAMAYENEVKTHREHIKKLEEENHKLKKEYENAKDSLLIKNKIIDDQQQSLKQQKDKSEEIKTLVKKNQSLERIINIEREEKIELQDAVERLKWRKEELKKKIKSLEDDLLMAPQEVVRDLQKTQNVLHELEAQVQIKQKEWELHLQSLIREKEQACSVAEFATKKLMQTTSEFQKQSEAHKRLHKVLAENLAEKGKKLKEVNENVSSAQINKSLTEQVRPNSPIQKHSNFNSKTEFPTPLSRWYRSNLASTIIKRT